MGINTTRHISYDVVIIGAGLVGLSCALSLPKTFRVLLLESRPPLQDAACSLKPITLSYGSAEILMQMDVWKSIEWHGGPIQKVVVSEQGHLGSLHFCAQEYTVPALGYVFSADILHDALYHNMLDRPNIECIHERHFLSLTRSHGYTEVTTKNTSGDVEIWRAPILIACDGTHSDVKKFLNWPTQQIKKKRTAYSALIHLKRSHHGVALERFTRDGCIALLPLHHTERCGVVCVPNTEQMAWNGSTVSRLFGTQIPPVVGFQTGSTFSIEMSTVNCPVRPGVVLLGNAAHTLYPLAAQGFNLSLRQAWILSQVLAHAMRAQKPLNAPDVLQSYKKYAQIDRRRITWITKMASLGLGPVSILSRVRSLGLMAIDLMQPIKKRIAQWAMGTGIHSIFRD